MSAIKSPLNAMSLGSGTEGNRLASDTKTIVAVILDDCFARHISLNEYTIIRISRTPGDGELASSSSGTVGGLNMYQMRSARTAVRISQSRRCNTLKADTW